MKTVLMIDDSRDDFVMFALSIKWAHLTHSIQSVEDGQTAIAYLSGFGGYADRVAFPLPSLIVLDIYMPSMNGHEVLKWIRSVKLLDSVPIIMFSDAFEAMDVSNAYAGHANDCVEKPTDYYEFRQSVTDMMSLWMKDDGALRKLDGKTAPEEASSQASY
jgi:CheY-like chemotaxis protein